MFFAIPEILFEIAVKLRIWYLPKSWSYTNSVMYLVVDIPS